MKGYKRIKMVFVTAVVLLAGVLHSYAGGPDKDELERARKTFPNADAVFLHKNMHTNVEIVNGELVVTSNVDEDIYFITEQSDAYSKYAVYHSYFTDINNLNAVTLSNNGGKYKEMKVENYTTADNVDANVFYDDLKEVNFIFPGATPGSIGKISYVEKLKDAHFMSPFYFVSYMPVLNSEFTISCPVGVKLNYQLYNNDSNFVSFSKEEKGKRIIYRWMAKNMQTPKRESESPAFAYYAPHVLITVNDYTVDGVTKKVLPDVTGLCEWYKGFVKDINKGDDSLLRSTVTGLVKDARSDEEKIRLIYYWVQDNINYIAFEDGLNGFIPREANDICKRRYGDCKDMSSILVKMLRIAGVKAYHTWIGTRKLPYRYSEIASPSIDNHMICIAEANGKRYVLDGTGKFTPLGFVTEFIQGKEALLLKEDGSCEVYTIPVMAKEKSVESDTITASFDSNKQLNGAIQTDFTGYYKIDDSYMYHYTLPEKREEKFENYMKIGNNKCKIIDLYFEGFNGQDSIVKLKAKFELPEYAKSIGSKIYLNPNLEKDKQFDNIDVSERHLPLEVGYKNVKKSTTVITLPEGYTLDYKPEDVSFKGKDESFQISYKTEGNKVIQTKTIETDFLMLSVNEMKDWNSMIAEMNKAYKENLVLIKK